jgi:endonuclease-8
VGGLGPDLLSADFDRAEALRRLRAEAGRELGDAVLIQSVVAGIGNIWKSEALFACRLDPFARVSSFADDDLGRVLDTARRLLAESVERTVAGARARRHAVYARSGRPCRVCKGPIAMRRQGDAGRSTYFCATCQPSRRAAPISGG